MRNAAPLAEYRRKRDPAATPEPMGGRRRGRSDRFVIQKHRARRLHYDLRLEMDGVLKSWAVPKGPSVDPRIKRLAVEVEDHPLEYASFEGVIPGGQYGAGTVVVWDRGTYALHGPKPPAAQLADGHLDLELRGEKLRGRWTLVRAGGRGRDARRHWLLIKKDDAFAGGAEPVETRPGSVLSAHDGRKGVAQVDDAADPPPPGARAPARADRRLPRARLSAPALPFMLPTLVAEVPRDGWLYEIKWDGVRVLILRRGGAVTLHSRAGGDVTRRYPEIAAAAARLAGGDLALDAEIVAAGDDGRPSFHRLQRRIHRARAIASAVAEVPVVAWAYDCLALGGRDLRGLPLGERKARLRELVGSQGALRYCDHVEGDGRAVLETACEMGLEGIVAKRADAPYRGGRRREWLKIKCRRRQELVIGGYTEPRGGRSHLGALHLGVYEGGALTYAGKVGSGLDEATLADLARRLAPLATDRCPFTRGDPPRGREHRWVRPALVCEVRFGEWTPDGRLRHPVFLGLRADKRPRAVRREEPVTGGVPGRTPGGARGSAPPRSRRRPRSGG
jgi:bifunctional non-homologous end joining protein LigD